MHDKRGMSEPVNLRTIREQLGLKRRDVAEMAGVDVSTICRWELSGVPSGGLARRFVDDLAVRALGCRQNDSAKGAS